MTSTPTPFPLEPLTDRLIALALEEDLGAGGDITTSACVDEDTNAVGTCRAKERLVVSGLDVFVRVFAHVDPRVVVERHVKDGATVESGTVVATVTGPARSLLIGERPALNFLMRLSGIATHTADVASALAGTKTRLIDTRKTTPGWRALEKRAVVHGGARGHRMGLFDGVLIKDNHITAAGGIEAAVLRAREHAHHLVKIEVEVATLPQLEQCLALGVEALLLDNMNDALLTQAVQRVRAHEQQTGRRVVLEASGNMTKERLPRVAQAGVDLVSMGGLTHQAKSVDLSLKIQLGETPKSA